MGVVSTCDFIFAISRNFDLEGPEGPLFESAFHLFFIHVLRIAKYAPNTNEEQASAAMQSPGFFQVLIAHAFISSGRFLAPVC